MRPGKWKLVFGICVLQSRASTGAQTGARIPRFGFCPKISTPVENTVEKQAFHDEVPQKTSFPAMFRGAKVSHCPYLGHI